MSIKDTLKMIGAVAPSSSVLARAMVHYAISGTGPILEVGAGTGPITKILAKKAVGRVDVVEIIPEFAKLLERRFGQALNIHNCNILDFDTKTKYQYIISSLPFNAFSPDVVSAIINKLKSLATDDAVLSFFEYRIVQGILPMFFSKNGSISYQETRKVIDQFVSSYQFEEKSVYLNIPPAVVHYLSLNKGS